MRIDVDRRHKYKEVSGTRTCSDNGAAAAYCSPQITEKKPQMIESVFEQSLKVDPMEEYKKL